MTASYESLIVAIIDEVATVSHNITKKSKKKKQNAKETEMMIHKKQNYIGKEKIVNKPGKCATSFTY